MNGPALVAEHLDHRTEALLAAWRSTLRSNGDVPRSESLTHAEFVDHVPELIDRMAERLRGHEDADVAAEAEKHGRMRWLQGYDMAEVVAELGHLRTVLTRATFGLARDDDFGIAELESALTAIDEVLNEAATESVRQFQEEGQAVARATLAEAEERRRAVEEAGRAAEAERAKLRTILENLPVGVWVADADGIVRELNREAERLQGFPAEEVVGQLDIHRHRSTYRVLRPDGTEYGPGEVPLARALRGEVIRQEEMIWRQPDRTRVIATNAAPLTGPGGAVVGGMLVGQDITDQRQAEAAAGRGEERLRIADEVAGLGAWDYDLISDIFVWSDRLRDILGFPPGTGASRQLFLSRVHPEDRDRVARDVERALDPAGDGVYEGEERLLLPDGTVRWIGSRGRVYFEGTGPNRRAARFIGKVRNVTEAKRLETELASASAQLKTIVEQAPVLIWRTDDRGRGDYVNRTYLDFTGRSLEEHLGDYWAEAIHPDDREGYLAAWGAAFEALAPFEAGCRFRRHDGQYRSLLVRAAPYRDADGRFLGYLGSCLDITERVDLEASLEQQKQLAEESARHKGRLMSALSHDARTPLNAVVLSAQLLEMQVGDSANPEVQECLRTIRHSIRNVLDLLGDLLNLTKIDAGADPVEVSRFALGSTLAECLASIEGQAHQKGLDVRLDAGELAEAAIETDRAKLKQVLGNLLSNALRYTERGHVILRARHVGDQLRIGVEDTGPGVAPADQSRIFEEFATLDNPQRPVGEGTGLGLAISRRLANLLQGEIQLESTPGRGSTFTLALPASVLAPGSSAEIPAATPVVDPGPGPILVVEDHLGSRQALAKLLRRMGHRVREAGNGRDALAQAREERPAAILLDVNMPVMNGIDATLALRADATLKDVAIFALTGDVSLVNQRAIAEAGVDGFIEKPVTADALTRALGSLGRR